MRSAIQVVGELIAAREACPTQLLTLGAESYATVLAEHREIIRTTCTHEGGVEVDTRAWPSEAVWLPASAIKLTRAP